ncbi:lymphocyte-specific protein 1-like isoform X2 [Cheilinus undulatus]|uniref:lymphocyte-specific protein 1-like isoform X2 n=1 Tax=Cheilinus undulatus TaxID=241271 RepID=UPI001BD52232|nr:lymphocyte-specific protein 1-like isoform X2 [Cheilinus undulatus]
MSESIRRKSSSRQLLQNLIRVTAQRSQEDAEEVERERRRRARERQRGEGSVSWPEPPQQNEIPLNIDPDEELKPSCCLVLEEDEGFSDWTHRLENRNEQEVQDTCGARLQRSTTSEKPETGEENHQEDREEGRNPEWSRQSQEAPTKPPEKMSSNRKEVRMSYSSTVFLPQDVRLPDRTSYLVAGTMKPRRGGCRMDGELKQEEQKEDMEVHPDLQRVRRPTESRQGYREEEEEEEEELGSTHEEKEAFHIWREQKLEEEEEEELGSAHEEKEDFHIWREEKLEEEEEGEMPDERSEVSRSDEVNRTPSVSVSSSEGDETFNCYGPMSPTFKKLLIQFYPDEANSRVSTDSRCKIIERTESLRKSTGGVKKTLPPLPVPKINKKLEQYTHALEVSSKESRAGSHVPTDLTNQAEPVSLKKNLFEAGDAWNQNIIPAMPSKDVDGFKVGVADLINQWVRGSEDLSRCSSPFRPTESCAGKRYKFVVTGHGKYEKVSVDQDSNDQSGEQIYEDL